MPTALCKVDQHATTLTRSRSLRSARDEQTRVAGLRGAKLRHRTAGTTLSRSRSLRSARSEQTRAVGLRRGEAATSNGRYDPFSEPQLAKRTQRADASCGPSRGEAAARRAKTRTGRRRRRSAHACAQYGRSGRSLRKARLFAKLRASARGGFGPPTSATSNGTCLRVKATPARSRAEGLATSARVAALRQGAAAGCRTACDFSLRPQSRLRPADLCEVDRHATILTRSHSLQSARDKRDANCSPPPPPISNF